ncbi:MAG: ribosomal protein S18-alanine N-acetyltransferase [Rhodospirillales bacterium]|nr:ribosomal protein S18-alanine N-acetyltransferase [Rhodospirillales bacterium]
MTDATSNLEIIKGGVTFAPVFAAIHQDCFDESWSEKALVDLLAMPGAFSFVAVEEDQPVGFILCRVGGEESEVITVGVLRNNQRQGVALQLLEQGKKEARKRGASEVILEVAENNKAALGLYLKQGFTQVGLRKKYYKQANNEPIDALILKSTLS